MKTTFATHALATQTALFTLCALAVQTASLAAATPVIVGNTWTFTVDSGSETYSTEISGNVKVVKEGAGTLVLGASANTFTGGIEVNGGTLQGTLTALGGKLDVAASTAAPQPLVSVADGATLSIVNTTCNGNYTARLAKELRVAGHGADGKGAVQRPSGSGSMHSLFDKIVLTGDATLSSVQRWGFAPGSTLDMGGHDLKIIGGDNFEIYNGAVTVENAGKIELISGKFLMQGEFADDTGSIQLDGGTFQLWGRTVPLSWPVAVAGNATMLAGSGTSRASNIVSGDIDLGATLTLNTANTANRFITLRGGIDGPGTMVFNGTGSLYVTGSAARTIGALTVASGNMVLENAGTFCVTNAAEYRGSTSPAKVAGAWASFPRLVVTDSTFALPVSAAGTTSTVKKHYLFVGGGSGEFGVLDIQAGGVVSNDLSVGRSAGSVGAVYLNDGGTLFWRGGVNNQGWIGDSGYGYLAVNDGAAFESEGLLTVGAYGNTSSTGGVGIVHMRGGTARFTRSNNDILYSLRLGRDNNSYGHWYQTGGSSTFANHVALCYADLLVDRENVESVLTLSGADTSMSIADGRYLEACVSTKSVTGIVNLNDGATLTVRRMFKNYASTEEKAGTTDKFNTQSIRESVAASKFYLNFDGGVLKPAQYGTLFNNRGGVYDDPDRVTVYEGGAVVDTSLCSGGNQNWSAPVLKPSGNVLLSVSLPTDSAWVNKYIAPPRVVISGVNEHGATAVAEFDEATGKLTGITVTSPGNNVPSDISVTIKGGNLASTFACPFVVDAPAKDGGFTKRGDHLLEMIMPSATPNTWEGPTTVEGGTLKFTNGTYPNGSPLVLKGGTLALGGYAVTVPSLEGYGAVTGSGGVTVSDELRISCADLFGESRTIAAQKVTLASGATLVVTDPENLAQYKNEEAAVFLTASDSLSGDAPALEAEVAALGWRCSKIGNSLKFGFPQAFVLVVR